MEIYLHAQMHNWENCKIADQKSRFWIMKTILFLAGKGYLVKLLSNHQATLSPENIENISNFEGWGLTLVDYKKESVVENF